MKTRIVVAAAAALAGGCTTTARVGPAGFGFTDLTDDFAAAYDAGAADEAARVAHIRNAIEPHLPGFHDPERLGDQADFYRGMMAEFLRRYPGEREAIADSASKFGAMFAPAVADFERRVGAVPTETPVFLVVSMGEFDGATRTLGGREYLLFGADMIARLHGGDARAFVQHELFHVYHSPRFENCAGLYCSLWSEGLAVHAAQSLNPGASDDQLLLTIPEPIRPALEANRREAVCTTLAKLDSRDGADWNAFFSGGRLNDRLPPRFGYLVGAWIAADLGRTRSLAELAEIDGPELRPLVESSLRGMADCA